MNRLSIEVGESKIVFADELDQWSSKDPQTFGDLPNSNCLCVEDVDAMFAVTNSFGYHRKLKIVRD